MKAHVGDRIIVHSTHVGEPNRDGEVLEVRGADGSPPFVVRWSDSGHEGLYFPSSDAVVKDADTPHP
jgi:hypothetical protein